MKSNWPISFFFLVVFSWVEKEEKKFDDAHDDDHDMNQFKWRESLN